MEIWGQQFVAHSSLLLSVQPFTQSFLGSIYVHRFTTLLPAFNLYLHPHLAYCLSHYLKTKCCLWRRLYTWSVGDSVPPSPVCREESSSAASRSEETRPSLRKVRLAGRRPRLHVHHLSQHDVSMCSYWGLVFLFRGFGDHEGHWHGLWIPSQHKHCAQRH